MTQLSCKPPAAEEHGAILLLTIFLVVALLAVGALALDSSNMYRHQLNMQKAADAAVLAAVQYRVDVGWTEAKEMDGGHYPSLTRVEGRAVDIARANLQLNRIPIATDCSGPIPIGGACITATYSPSSICPAPLNPAAPPSREEEQCWNPYNDKVKVEIRYQLDFLLMHLVPFDILGLARTSRNQLLRVVSEGGIQRVNLAIMVDNSASMLCPADPTQSCACRATNSCDREKSKLKGLKTALKEFHKRYNPLRDRIAIIPFGTWARPIAAVVRDPTQRTNEGAKVEDIIADRDQKIDALEAEGATNICDAQLVAHRQFKFTGLLDNPKEITASILFSDGTPTAGRFCYANPRSSDIPARSRECYPVNANWLNRPGVIRKEDLCSVALTWVQPDPNNIASTPITSSAPSSLVYCRRFRQQGAGVGAAAPPLGWFMQLLSDTIAPPDPNDPPGQGRREENKPACSHFKKDDFRFSSDTANTMGQCLDDLGFLAPDDNKTVYAPAPLSEWQEQYFRCAVVYSDELRRRGIPTYVIGLGQPPPPPKPGAPPRSEFGNLNNTDQRNDQFLSRVACDWGFRNDIRSPEDPDRPVEPRLPRYGIFPTRAYGGFNPTCFDPKEFDGRPGNFGIDSAGAYLPTPKAQELTDIFTSISRRINTRLVNRPRI